MLASLLGAVLLCLSPVSEAILHGLHFDPERSCHGFDLQPVGDVWVIAMTAWIGVSTNRAVR